MKSELKVKAKIVCAWTGQVRHSKISTTNRVESVHATLKNWLGDSKGNFFKGWEPVNKMIEPQHNEIHTSFGCSITVLKHRFRDKNKYS